MSQFEKGLDVRVNELCREISAMEDSLSGEQSDSKSKEVLAFIEIKKLQLKKLQELQESLKNIDSQFGREKSRSRTWLNFKAKVYAWLGSVGLAAVLIYKLIEINYGIAIAEGVMQAMAIIACFIVVIFFIRHLGGKS